MSLRLSDGLTRVSKFQAGLTLRDLWALSWDSPLFPYVASHPVVGTRV